MQALFKSGQLYHYTLFLGYSWKNSGKEESSQWAETWAVPKTIHSVWNKKWPDMQLLIPARDELFFFFFVMDLELIWFKNWWEENFENRYMGRIFCMNKKHEYICVPCKFSSKGDLSREKNIYSQVDQFSSVQWLSCVRLFATPWIAARQASLSITNSQSSPRLTSIESVMPSSRLILCHPLLLLPPIHPSIRVFSNESTFHMRRPKYWSFSFSIIPSKEHPGPISFRMGWLDLLTVQGTLKSLLQHHSSKASILQRSAFFTVQFSHPFMTTGKTIALTRWTFVGKVMSLLLNMLSRLVINFFPRSKHLLISWLQSPSVVILEPPKIKSDTVSTVSPSICHEVMGLDAMILVFWILSFKVT